MGSSANETMTWTSRVSLALPCLLLIQKGVEGGPGSAVLRLREIG